MGCGKAWVIKSNRNYVKWKIYLKIAWLIKKCAPVQNGQCEKSCEIKRGGQEMAVMVKVDDKTLIATIQVNLWCFILTLPEISTKFTWIVATKILSSTYTITAISWLPFLFHIFFPLAILNRLGLHLFLQPGFFWVYITCFCNLTCVFLNQARAHSQPTQDGLLKYFQKIVCLYLSTYLCLYALTHVSKPF